MRKLIGSTHVSLGGEIGSPQKWAFPYLNEEHHAYAAKLLFSADALLLGRRTYEGLSTAYMGMADHGTGTPSEFVERMNSIPKFVASRTLRETVWNATVIEGDVATFVASLKSAPGGNIVKYGTGPLDTTLMQHGRSMSSTFWSHPSPSERANISSRTSTLPRNSNSWM